MRPDPHLCLGAIGGRAPKKMRDRGLRPPRVRLDLIVEPNCARHGGMHYESGPAACRSAEAFVLSPAQKSRPPPHGLTSHWTPTAWALV
jgi:hypothetical protein